MVAQDKHDGISDYNSLTGSIIGCAIEVINELGTGFLESVYEKALIIALTDAGLAVESQKSIHVRFRSKIVGEFYADLCVEGNVLVELKTVKTLLPEHLDQTINYLKATGIGVGLLINFSTPQLDYKRFIRKK